MGSPPPSGTKKLVPKLRSKVSSISPTVMTGKASTSSTEVTRVIQTNRGIRIRLIPGARILTMVTMKLKAAAREDTPSTCKPKAQ